MELLTVQETARVLKVNPITIRRYIAEGRLAAVKVGKGVRVRKDSLDQFVTPIEPKTQKQKRRATGGRPLTYEDPMWKLVGSATTASPTDASRKHEYLAGPLAAENQ